MKDAVKKTKSKGGRAKKPGLPPGSLVYTGSRASPEAEKVKIKVFDYNLEELHEKECSDLEECLKYCERESVTWINVDGVHDLEKIQRIGDHFKINPLVLEDIVHTTQRPKVEDHAHYLYLVVRMLDYDTAKHCISSEQISLILTKNCVVSFQENVGDVFDPIRERIRQSKGRLRRSGPDYLMYSLIDAIVDHYFIVLERIGERIQEIEERVVDSPTPELAHTLHFLKQEAILIRKAAWPLRDVVSSLERTENELLADSIDPFLRDLYDHSIRAIDSVETYRDILSGLLEVYLATVSNKMNEVMKVLTIISTIFIPLTFIAGIYGMNFRYMPELEWHYGYLAAWILMALVAGGMLLFFKKKRWI